MFWWLPQLACKCLIQLQSRDETRGTSQLIGHDQFGHMTASAVAESTELLWSDSYLHDEVVIWEIPLFELNYK